MAWLPTLPGVEAVDMRMVERTLLDETDGGAHVARLFGAPRWAFTLRYPALTQDEFRPVSAFLQALRGPLTAFEVLVPLESDPRGVATGIPVVSGAGQSGLSLVTSGWTPSITGILRAGDPVVVAGHTRVLRLAADTNSSGTGTATLTFTTPLMHTPANAAALTVRSVPYRVRLAAPLQRYRIAAPNHYDFELDVVESWS